MCVHNYTICIHTLPLQQYDTHIHTQDALGSDKEGNMDDSDDDAEVKREMDQIILSQVGLMIFRDHSFFSKIFLVGS